MSTTKLTAGAALLLGAAGLWPADAQPPPAGGAAPKAVTLKTEGAAWRLAWSGDGKVLATAAFRRAVVKAEGKEPVTVENSTVQLWDPATGRMLHTLGEEQDVHVETLACAPDGSAAAAGVLAYGKETAGTKVEVRLVDVRTGGVRAVEDLEGLLCVAFSPDGTALAAAGNPGDRLPSDRVVRLWDRQAGKVAREVKEDGSGERKTEDRTNLQVTAVAFSPDGKTLAALCHPAAVLLFDPAAGKRAGAFELPAGDSAFAVAYSADGKTLAVATRDRVRLLDPRTGKERRALEPDEEAGKGQLMAAAVSPDGALVAAGFGSGRCLVWDAATGELKGATRGKGPRTCVAFSPDGKALAVGEATGAGDPDREGKEAGTVTVYPVAELLGRR